jgi:hypothetical protein
MPQPDHHILVTLDGHTLIANWQGLEGFNVSNESAVRHTQHRELGVQIDLARDELDKTDMSERQKEDVFGALTVAHADLYTWSEQEREGRIDYAESYFRVAFTAAWACEVIHHRATVSTPEIINAADDVLEEWAQWYESEARRVHGEMVEIEGTTSDVAKHAGWALLNAQFHRFSWLWWQCARRIGHA